MLDDAGPEAYVTVHDLLFADQPEEGGSGLTDGQLIAHAVQAGAGASVESGITGLRYGDWVAQATDQASKDGVTGTPTLLVDGERLADLTPEGLADAVAAAQR